jgi:2-dehydropantoate 2-reductase
VVTVTVRLLVWGAGAIGGTLGAYFQRAGHDVTFVDIAEEHVRAINEHGLRITGPIDEFSVRAPALTPGDMTGSWETILLCTKAHHTAAAVQSLVPFLAADGCVVSAQNGLNERTISQHIGEHRTVGCFVNFGADYLEPGVIHYGGRGAVVLGELDGRSTERLAALHKLFLEFDAAAIPTSNIWGYLWGKLAYGAMLFATALTNASIADALAEPSNRPLFTALGREVMRVAQAQGIRAESFNGFDPNAFDPTGDDQEAYRSLEDMVAFNRKSAKTHSGIWRDLAVRKRKTEVDAQLGPIATTGQEVGVATPLTARLIELIHEIETGEREQGPEALAALNQAF